MQARTRILLTFVAAVLASLLYFYFDPSLHAFFPPCPFYALTGLFCPGCGSQRAMHDLLHADAMGAAGHNLLFVLFLPLVGYAALGAAAAVFGRPLKGSRIFHSTLLARVVLAIVVGFWVLRNVPVHPFSWLAP